MLAANIISVAQQILPQGRLDRPGGDEWCIADVRGRRSK
jgi:hypothetical protein